ncbi:TlpA family protein disulfide reductase [Sediminibacterium sp.]|uniref:TlpA family protein disulfide reductase n=1 Tax=Sediminibacterium sp. TaxID=1917865 RepID=UPI003F696E8D
MRNYCILLCTIFLYGQVVIAQKNHSVCILQGVVKNRTSDTIYIRKSTQDLRAFLENPIKIPVKNGAFTYQLPFTETEAFELIFQDELEKGSWSPIHFFPYSGRVAFELYPQKDWLNNRVEGGVLNKSYVAFRSENQRKFQAAKNNLYQTRDSLIRVNAFETAAYQQIFKDLRQLKPDDQDGRVPLYQKSDEMEKTGARYTDLAKQLYVNPFDSLMREEYHWKYQYLTQHISLSSYYSLWTDVMRVAKDNRIVAQYIRELFPVYKKKFPGHVYTKSIEQQLNGLQKVAVGNPFLDVKVFTLDGDTMQLSKVITAKITLIDFWGSWCGPCIAKMRLVKPLYERFKNKGFVIVGIAREFQSLAAVKNRIAIENYVWHNLFDIDDKLNVWNKYGINNGVGMMVVVDQQGKIVAIDPKANELEALLIKTLE